MRYSSWFRSGRAFTVAVVLAMVCALWCARGWHDQARVFPNLVCTIIIVLGLLDIALELRRERSMSEEAPSTTEQINPPASVARVFAWVFGFFGGSWLVGLYLSVPIFLFAYLYLEAKARWYTSAVLTASTFVILFELVTPAMQLRIPGGVVF